MPSYATNATIPRTSVPLRSDRYLTTNQNHPALAGGFFQDRPKIKFSIDCTAQPIAVRKVGLPRPTRVPTGTNKIFSLLCGTAGQMGLSQIHTIINCPTLLSHFVPPGTKNGKSYAFRRDPTRPVHNLHPHRSTGFTPKGVTLTFFWDTGTWDKTGTRIDNLRLS